MVPELPEGRTAIGSWIVFKQKCDGDGNLVKFKDHIVMKGFLQVPGQDFTEIFSSVAKVMTLCVLLSYVAHEDWELDQVDIIGAHLHGNLDEDLYLEVLEGVEEAGRVGGYWRLRKML